MLLLLNVVLICLIASPIYATQNITIDTVEDLDLVEGTSGSCYYEKQDYLLCKAPTLAVGRTGFWASCEQIYCEISIVLGKLGNNAGQVPSRVGLVTLVLGDVSVIRARYRFSPGSPTVNINPAIEFSADWTTTWFDLTTIPVLVPESEFVIRLASPPQSQYVDLLDKIIFTIEGEEETTFQPPETTIQTTEPTTVKTEPTTQQPETTEPTTLQPSTTEPTTLQPETTEPTTQPPATTEPTTQPPTTTEPTTQPPTTQPQTTTEPTTQPPATTEPTTLQPEPTTVAPTTERPPPPGPVVTIDTYRDLNLVGTPGICAYVESTSESCKSPLPSTSSVGFWSSCRIFNCEITIRVGNLGNLARIPNEVKVAAFVSGPAANIQVQYRVNTVDAIQTLTPVITPAAGWVTTPFDLSKIVGFNPDSEIIIQLASDMTNEYVDVLDKLIFTFSLLEDE